VPIEAKPLFRPDVLRAHPAGFELPDHLDELRPKLKHWADLLASGKVNTFKEQEILPDFLTDFFCGLLAYTRPADGGPRYTLGRAIDGQAIHAQAHRNVYSGRHHAASYQGPCSGHQVLLLSWFSVKWKHRLPRSESLQGSFVLRSLSGLLGLAADGIEHFFSVRRHAQRAFNPEANFVATDFDHGHGDAVSDDKTFIFLAREEVHSSAPL
jgi:hypothetical protein